MGVYRCGHCDVRFIHPPLSAEEEARLYAAEFEKFMTDRSAAGAGWEKPEAHIRANEGEAARRMGHLSSVIRPGMKVLEVGCSSGFMLYRLAEAGCDCTGVEPSGIFSDYVRSRGIPVYSSLDDLPADARFDLIIHYYVLEHIGRPQDFLKAQIARLAPGGKLVFEVPNANDALTTLYDIPAYERFIWVKSHRWYFSERSLAHLMKGLGRGSEVRLDQRYDLSNHLVWARDGRPGGMGRFAAVFGPDLDAQYRKTLVESGHCDTLIGAITA